MSYKRISNNLTLYYKTFYPYSTKTCSDKNHLVVLGVGGNKGNMFLTLKKLFLYFKQDRRVDLIKTAPILKNPPFGYTKQKYFLNTIIVLKTNLSPNEMLKYVLSTEKYFGRKRSFKNAPRILDLDIIMYDDLIIHTKKLQIPHPHFTKRESVIIPLSLIYNSKGLR